MAQRPKDEMRRAILTAAADELAELGFERATLASIAARGGTSIGNLYKYFANKDELFHAAVPPEVATELRERLRHRVRALGLERDVRDLRATHPYEVASRDLFSFVIAHRAQILFLLSRAEGSRYASFANELAQSLTKLAVEYVTEAYPAASLTPARRRALLRIYRAFIATISAILREEGSERALREATDHFASYHLAGLKAFFESSSV